MFTFLFAFLFVFSTKAHIDEAPQSLLYSEERTLNLTVEATNYLEELKFLKSIEAEVLGVDYKNKIIDILINESQFKEVQKKNLNFTVIGTSGVIDIYLDPEYQDPFEIERFVQTAESLFPELAKAVSIGKSVEGRDIWAVKISDNVTTEEPKESAILFNSMHHAREVMTAEVGIDIIEYLLSNYASDAKVKKWIDNYEIWVVPMFNVDGNAKVWEGQNMWRKNTRGGYGVDLNRNYPFNWNTCNGSSGSTWSDTYRGPSAASEPETQALMALVTKIKPVFDISYHSFSEMVLYPYGCKNMTHQNKMLVQVGKELGQKLNYTPGTPYELLYEADGGDIDWMFGEHQVLAYVFEISSRADGFQPSYKEKRDVTVERNRKGWMHLLDRMSGPGIRGYNPKFSEKEITILQEGRELQKYKVNPDGSFHIVLDSGRYEVVFPDDNKKEIVLKDSIYSIN